MSATTKVTFGAITPYLHYEDAGAALDWLARVFGFDERARYVDADGVVQESEILAGETEIWIAGHGPGYWQDKGRAGGEGLFIVWVDDVDAMYERVVAAGVKAEPPHDQSYDVRSFTVTDPEGYQWGFFRRLGRAYDASEGGLEEIRGPAYSPRTRDDS